MKKIIVTTQKEIDSLPDSFQEETWIYIQSQAEIWLQVKKQYNNAHVVARESSHVVARESSHVVARESSHVVARESSHVVARESSHVEAWESSHVEARGSSHVVARGNSSIKIQNINVEIEALYEYAIAICIEEKCTIKKKDKTAQVIVCPRVTYNIKSFCGIYKQNKIDDKTIILYKSVKPDNTDFYTGKIKYKIGKTVECPDWNPDKNIECGNGLHLSPTPELTQNYNTGKILKCEANIKDIVVYPYDIAKVRCRKIKVIEEYKDNDNA